MTHLCITVQMQKGELMSEKKYLVADENGVLARGMSLDDALMFIKAYCEKYYMEFVDLDLQQEIPVRNSSEENR